MSVRWDSNKGQGGDPLPVLCLFCAILLASGLVYPVLKLWVAAAVTLRGAL